VFYSKAVLDVSDDLLVALLAVTSIFLTVCLSLALRSTEEKMAVVPYLVFSILVACLAIVGTVFQLLFTFYSQSYTVESMVFPSVAFFLIILGIAFYATLMYRSVSAFSQKHGNPSGYKSLDEESGAGAVPLRYSSDQY
jgi:hypothetical protein